MTDNRILENELLSFFANTLITEENFKDFFIKTDIQELVDHFILNKWICIVSYDARRKSQLIEILNKKFQSATYVFDAEESTTLINAFNSIKFYSTDPSTENQKPEIIKTIHYISHFAIRIVQYHRALCNERVSMNYHSMEKGKPACTSIGSMITRNFSVTDEYVNILDIYSGAGQASIALILCLYGLNTDKKFKIFLMEKEDYLRDIVKIYKGFKKRTDPIGDFFKRIELHFASRTISVYKDGTTSFHYVLQFHASRAFLMNQEKNKRPSGFHYGQLLREKFPKSMIIIHEINPFNVTRAYKNRKIPLNYERWANGIRDGLISKGCSHTILYPCPSGSFSFKCPLGNDRTVPPAFITNQKHEDGIDRHHSTLCRSLKYMNHFLNPRTQSLFWLVLTPFDKDGTIGPALNLDNCQELVVYGYPKKFHELKTFECYQYIKCEKEEKTLNLSQLSHIYQKI